MQVQCRHCPKTYATEYNLKRHMEAKHGYKFIRAPRLKRKAGESIKITSSKYYNKNKDEICLKKQRKALRETAKFELIKERLSDLITGKYKMPVKPTYPSREDLLSSLTSTKAIMMNFKSEMMRYKLSLEEFRKDMCFLSEENISARIIALMSGNSNTSEYSSHIDDDEFDSNLENEPDNDLTCSSIEEQ